MKTVGTLCFIGLALLTGCASTPRVLPPLPYERYNQMAEQWASTQKCGRLGMMDPATASLGASYITHEISSYAIDQPRLNTMIRVAQRDSSPTTEWCNEAAMTILTMKRQIAQNAAVSEANQRDLTNVINALQPATRNYITNPITVVPQSVQPNFNSFGSTGNDQYQLIMVNTPAGLVQKRCKVLNGQVVACF
jgi:hypothetical protein